MVSKRFLKLDFGPLSVDRSVDHRQSNVALSVDRVVDDMHQSAFVNFGRPGGRPTARALLSVGPGRLIESLTL